jgi:hypothetical protein
MHVYLEIQDEARHVDNQAIALMPLNSRPTGAEGGRSTYGCAPATNDSCRACMPIKHQLDLHTAD